MIYFVLGMSCILIPFLIILTVYYYVIIKQYKESEYFKVTHISYYNMIHDLGRTGEYYTYKYLSRLSGTKRFLFNCYVPENDDSTTEIDVLMIHTSGIYVIESKNYSGWIFGTETQKNWTQSFAAGRGIGKTKQNTFFNPIIQNKTHIKWLQEYLKEYPALPFYSYIVFSERCELKKINLASQEHVVLKRNNIFSAVDARVSAVGSVLSQETIDKIYAKIYPLSQADAATRIKHIQSIKAIKRTSPVRHQANLNTNASDSNISNINEASHHKVCPKCGGKLILRTAAKGPNAGKRFYGCSNYPRCRYLREP